MEPQVFNYITPERFDKLKQKAKEAGLSIGSDSGAVEMSLPFRQVIRMNYTYDRAGNVLTMLCTKKPFLVQEPTIIAKIQSLVTGTA